MVLDVFLPTPIPISDCSCIDILNITQNGNMGVYRFMLWPVVFIISTEY